MFTSKPQILAYGKQNRRKIAEECREADIQQVTTLQSAVQVKTWLQGSTTGEQLCARIIPSYACPAGHWLFDAFKLQGVNTTPTSQSQSPRHRKRTNTDFAPYLTRKLIDQV